MQIENRDFLFEEKERAWQQQEQQVSRIVDRLGKRIDEGIKEAVVALRLLGFLTTASCEGHIDWGLPGPWIDIGEVPKDIRKMFIETRKDPSKLDDQKKALIEETIQKGVEEKARLVELLAEFYQNRSVPYDQMLTMQYAGGDSAKLISQGTRVHKAYETNIRAERLNRYQHEMKTFTEFARNKFFYGGR
jgi:hypothetical protein